MNKSELKEIIERNKPEYKCKNCCWGNKIVIDKEADRYVVMCLFPNCIKKQKKKD